MQVSAHASVDLKLPPSALETQPPGAEPIGRVTVPLANLLTLRGPKPAAASWFRILPISPASRGGLKENKMEGVLPETPGSGLSLPKEYSSLGFLQLGVQVRRCY